ncbi:uncharacterized protein UV8b_04018 [Ustilaginoidea virens]|uniref:Uncharacterized protein n=1 Tax=Ustilaginoidea virens TaxID=1159556 RepID=A0A8E5MHN5_USTVR|nr:uncharacterized protein UV8b_04018 [Ustilaginoidea virens]QUC19777.1 hypothetical protein UV8b_04018 [Ustilaginoidea virens]
MQGFGQQSPQGIKEQPELASLDTLLRLPRKHVTTRHNTSKHAKHRLYTGSRLQTVPAAALHGKAASIIAATLGPMALLCTVRLFPSPAPKQMRRAHVDIGWLLYLNVAVPKHHPLGVLRAENILSHVETSPSRQSNASTAQCRLIIRGKQQKSVVDNNEKKERKKKGAVGLANSGSKMIKANKCYRPRDGNADAGEWLSFTMPHVRS